MTRGSIHCRTSVGGYRQARIIPCLSELSEEYNVLRKLLINWEVQCLCRKNGFNAFYELKNVI